MSCYTRQLSKVFDLAGIEHSRDNRRRADPLIRRIVGKEGERCPAVWKEVKLRLASPDKLEELARRLREAFAREA